MNTIHSTDTKTIEVGIIVVDQTAPGILYSLAEVFAMVGVGWEMLTGKPSGAVRMTPTFVAERTTPINLPMNGMVQPQLTFQDDKRFDLVIASDLLLPADFNPRGNWQSAAQWIKTQYDKGAMVCSVCTGTLLLAESGVLKGNEATTHWGTTGLFRECYPDVLLSPEKVLSLSGLEQRLITAGGASSWIELVLYLINYFCGAEEASCISKVFLFGDRSEGQLPFASMARARCYDDAVIDKCQAWIAEHYERRNPVAQMVEYSGLTERTFKRRFRTATGYTPIEYVQTLRIEEAKHLLETTKLSGDDIALEIGYDDPATFRRLFKRKTGITPAKYRQRFQVERN
ncbi:MAG: helix-turn-helix domain-containing protein [Pseudomonadales bacterium]|nr:helix-turn-helix domain-containing protein [Pseudomonadales bacterium]